MSVIMNARIAKVLSKNVKGRALMSSAMTREAAVALVSRVEKRKRSRMLAYEFVASRIDRSVTWVRDFVGHGLGRIDSEIGEAIDDLLIREIEAELARLAHELEMARQSGAHPVSQHVSEIETHIARIRLLLESKAQG